MTTRLPRASVPVMFGAPAPAGELLPWSWAERRLRDARNYWIATVRPNGAPHCRPVWGVWLDGGFWFSTGSLARFNLPVNPAITVHLEDGDEVVLLEGAAQRETASLEAMCAAYTAKYDYPVSPVDGEIRDAGGTGGPVYRAAPDRVFGWNRDLADPTRWTFG